jgi:corrinoid protein of di/trimethylamine methyltransferase
VALSEIIFNKLRKGINEYDSDAVEKVAKEISEKGINPFEAIDVLTSTLKEIGDKYERMEIFVPELMLAAEAMKSGIAILEPLLKGEVRETLGTVVIGTVEGDIHDIGKNIVAMLLTGAGFKVIDIGVDVVASAFAEAVDKHNPDIVGVSTLMTTTMEMHKEIIRYFKEIGIRDKVKIMIGGAVVTKEYAEEIGADAFAANANEAVDVAKKLVGR